MHSQMKREFCSGKFNGEAKIQESDAAKIIPGIFSNLDACSLQKMSQNFLYFNALWILLYFISFTLVNSTCSSGGHAPNVCIVLHLIFF